MLEPAEILLTVERLLEVGHKDTGKRILITAGGTRERIDSVRYIGNMSSGRTAAHLSDELTDAGHRVTWLGAEDAVTPRRPCAMSRFYGFNDLALQLQTLLAENEYDAVIHAAAVSDFSVSSVLTPEGDPLDNRTGKLSSGSDLLLKLKPNPKLLDRIRTWSKNPEVRVIGFKLTDTEDVQQRYAAVKKQLTDSDVDAVVHNDLTDISCNAHPFWVYAPEKEPVPCKDGEALADTLNKLLETIS